MCQSGVWVPLAAGTSTGCTTVGSAGQVLTDNGSGGCTSNSGVSISGGNLTVDTTLLNSQGLFRVSNANLGFSGDSITVGYPGTSGQAYPAVLMGLSNVVGGSNTKTVSALGGWTIANLQSDYTTTLHPVSPAVTGKAGYLFVLTGTNDLYASASAATIESGLTTYWGTATADGWKVIAMTIPPNTNGNISTQETWALVNDWIRTATTLWWNIIDVANLFPDPYDTNFYYDGVHFQVTATINAYALLAQAANRALGTLSFEWPGTNVFPLGTGCCNYRGGAQSLYSLTTGQNNFGVGFGAGAAITTGGDNTALGSFAGGQIVTQSGNTNIGSNATSGTGNFNTFVGGYAGATGIFGAFNACVGQGACQGLTSGSSNSALGASANFGAAVSGASQIGSGTNSSSNSLQFQSWNFLDSSGNGRFQSTQLVTQAQPTCNSTNAGKINYTQGNSSTKDVVAVCAHDASNVYAWRAIY